MREIHFLCFLYTIRWLHVCTILTWWTHEDHFTPVQTNLWLCTCWYDISIDVHLWLVSTPPPQKSLSHAKIHKSEKMISLSLSIKEAASATQPINLTLKYIWYLWPILTETDLFWGGVRTDIYKPTCAALCSMCAVLIPWWWFDVLFDDRRIVREKASLASPTKECLLIQNKEKTLSIKPGFLCSWQILPFDFIVVTSYLIWITWLFWSKCDTSFLPPENLRVVLVLGNLGCKISIRDLLKYIIP